MRATMMTSAAIILVLGALMVTGQSTIGVKERHAQFEEWMRTHSHQAIADWGAGMSGSRPLTHTELYHRFSETMSDVDELNAEYSQRDGKATFKANHLALLSRDEFKRRFSSNFAIVPEEIQQVRRYNSPSSDPTTSVTPLTTIDTTTEKKNICNGNSLTSWSANPNRTTTIPRDFKEVDWQKAGAVTRVRNQGSCGSCYVFAMVAALEGMYQILNKKLLAFSEQYALDCSPTASCLLGCAGGSTVALAYAMQSDDSLGLFPLAKDYEYAAYANQTEVCNTSKKGHPGSQLVKAYSVGSWYEPSDATSIGNAELVMQVYIQMHGPLAVAVDASGPEWQTYAGGVLEGPCLPGAAVTKDSDLNHGVAIVGYGTTPEGVDYWRVKNSWTPEWGESGYVLIKRGCNAYGIGYFPVGGSLN